MPPRFGAYLVKALESAGFTQRKFSLLVGYARQNLNEVIQGKRPPPTKHVAKWADALKPHIDPKLFRELALLAQCPEEIQDLVERLRKDEKP